MIHDVPIYPVDECDEMLLAVLAGEDGERHIITRRGRPPQLRESCKPSMTAYERYLRRQGVWYLYEIPVDTWDADDAQNAEDYWYGISR